MSIPESPVEAIFSAALATGSPEKRAAYLDEARRDDPELRRRVERLLEAQPNLGSFLEAIPTEPMATSDAPAAPDCAGTVIGSYKLLDQIGEGGMGTVYLAQQTVPVKRIVALKVIKAGMDSRQVLARFAAERQALALFDHPNIAKVLDAGATDKGRPFFVMELVKGVPITRFCDERRLTPRERLKLFIHVCQAVQHAHQKGIIHRDLKPSNVLVGLYDGEPVTKIIDFGVAKATGAKLTETTLFTGFGQVVGTPEYMSPEQAQLDNVDIDTRSDIYSLGVLLYELLTGTTPLERKSTDGTALLEVLRIIREDDPPRPSTRLFTTEELPTIAANRGLEPRKLMGLIRGELDWIVMKALEKDRRRRYQTANGLATDLERYLADEPVAACPPSAWYRFRKLARRNKGPLWAACLLALSLVVGIIGTTWGMVRATHARADAVMESKLKERALWDKERALADAQKSERDKTNQLWQAMLAQARANRLSRGAGQRFETLEILRQATGLVRSLNLPDERVRDLRNAAIAALALPDLNLAGPSHPWPADGSRLDFDQTHTRYARTDRKGNCFIRRLTDDAELYRLPGRGQPYLSRDGKFVALVGSDAERQHVPSTQLWQLDGVTPRRVLCEAQARAVEFHRDGQKVALVYTDGSIGLFDLRSGRQLNRLSPDLLTREVVCALHPIEPLVAVCSSLDSVVQIRDLRTGDVLASLPETARPNCVAWDPDGRTLAVGLAEAHRIRLYDSATLQVLRTLESCDVASSVAFNHAGDRLVSTGWGKVVELFDVGTGQRLFATTPTPLVCVRFSQDDRHLAGTIQNGAISVWQVGDGREYRTLCRKAPPERVVYSSASVSADGRLLAAAMSDGFGMWDLASGRELAMIPTGGMNNCVLFEPTGALLALGPRGLFRWPVAMDSVATCRWVMGPPERLPLPRGSALSQSRDGRVIATCSRAVDSERTFAGGWVLRSDRAGQPIHLDAGGDVSSIAVSRDGRWVVTVNHNPSGLARVWDASDGRLVKQVADHGAAYPTFSPAGRWLSANLEGGRLVAAGTWEPGPWVGGAGTFAPDGKLIAIPTTNAVIRLVESATGRELAALEDPNQDGSLPPIFTPDGTELIAINPQKGIHVWDLRLVRQRLAEIGLDWDAPPHPLAGSPSEMKPLEVEILLGDLSKPVLTREQNARQAIELYRSSLKRSPDDAETCNRLAWLYLTAPEPLRDVKAALPLAERAVRLAPGHELYGNTLGVAYYRAGRYQEALAALRTNLALHGDSGLAFDLYFLAMSYHQVGEATRAIDYFNWAVRWTRADRGLSPANREELEMFRAEAEELLGIQQKKH
jgi:serine/threonine protein kinase/WD40 repeat protein